MQCDKNDISEGIDINKTDAPKECIFVIILLSKALVTCLNPTFVMVLMTIVIACELINIAILTVKGVNYRCVLWGVTRNTVINMLGNSKLNDKGAL